jgi:hypothetical protein
MAPSWCHQPLGQGTHSCCHCSCSLVGLWLYWVRIALAYWLAGLCTMCVLRMAYCVLRIEHHWFHVTMHACGGTHSMQATQAGSRPNCLQACMCRCGCVAWQWLHLQLLVNRTGAPAVCGGAVKKAHTHDLLDATCCHALRRMPCLVVRMQAAKSLSSCQTSRHTPPAGMALQHCQSTAPAGR